MGRLLANPRDSFAPSFRRVMFSARLAINAPARVTIFMYAILYLNNIYHWTDVCSVTAILTDSTPAASTALDPVDGQIF